MERNCAQGSKLENNPGWTSDNQAGRDPKTVQGLLCHANVQTTLQVYSHGRNEDRMTAQGEMLTTFFTPSTRVVQ
ncbi:MAG TPA: hypothetical protein VGE83_12080 [Terracidiphilus sp.]|jgi:hypothetical protein